MEKNNSLRLFVFFILFTILSVVLVPIYNGARQNQIIINNYNQPSDSITQYFINNTCDGYNLISPREGYHPILIDMQGRIIHESTIYGFPAKMFPTGLLIGSLISNEKLFNLGRKGTLYKFVLKEQWNNQITWEFNNWSNEWAFQHHDFHLVGSPVYYSPVDETNTDGNILILARLDKTYNKSISWCYLQDDVIYEVDSNCSLTGFQWHSNDHFDEMGFDIISKIGIYFCPAGQGWLHLNTCAEVGNNKWYQQGYEQFSPENIISCSRHANLIFIINKTTGKIDWKIGPNYYTGLEKKLGQIIGPHCAHIIPEGLPGEGNMLLFDNGGLAGYGLFGGFINFPKRYYRPYSRIIEFNPITLDIVWEYKNIINQNFSFINDDYFLSWFISSVQRLPNGNTLITEGTQGRIFEVSKDKDILWQYEYKNTGISLRNNWVYRAYRIPPEWVPGNPSGYTLWETLYE